MWIVYIIINKERTYRYIGLTKNIDKRLEDHNLGKTKSTKPYRPFDKIIILEKCKTRIEARAKEKYYKSGVGREKINILLSDSSSVG